MCPKELHHFGSDLAYGSMWRVLSQDEYLETFAGAGDAQRLGDTSPGYLYSTRAAAEILARFTGSRFFPGGLGEFVAERNAFLGLEQGPSERTALQWATYYDAADDAGTAALYGGLQPYFSDFAGRSMGSRIGQEVFLAAKQYFAGAPK